MQKHRHKQRLIKTKFSYVFLSYFIVTVVGRYECRPYNIYERIYIMQAFQNNIMVDILDFGVMYNNL